MKWKIIPFNGTALASILILLLSLIQLNCKSQTIAYYEFQGYAGDEPEGKVKFCAKGLKASSITRGSGIKPFKSQDMFCSYYWPTNTKPGISDYLEFTLTPDCGKSINLRRVQMYHKRSLTGPRWFSLRTSLDGFTADIGEIVKVSDVTNILFNIFNISLPEIISPLTIRIYAYYSESEAGQWGIRNDNDHDFFLIGTIKDRPILINEVDAETQVEGCDEFVELYDGGCGNKSLNNNVLVLYDGETGQSYKSIDLTGFSTNSNGFFTIGSENTENVDLVSFSEGNNLRNGSNGVALYSGSIFDFPEGTNADTINLIDAVIYKSNTPDSEAITHLLKNSELSIDESILGKPKEYSMQRMSDGSGGARRTRTFSNAYPTPGKNNYDLVWSGSLNNEWTEGANWIPYNSPPDISNTIFIPENVNNSLNIHSNQTIDEVVLDDNAQLNGQEYLNSSKVKVLHKVYFNQDEENINRWQYFITPFEGMSASDLLSQNNRVDLWIAEYNNSLSGNIDNCWDFIANPQQTLANNKGLAIASFNDETEGGTKICSPWYMLNGEGFLKNSLSPISYDLRIENSGWNLIGNPFLAPINWFDKSNVDYTNIQGRASYLYNPSTENYITIISDGEGNGTVVPSSFSQYIPAMQGFFVEANNSGIFNMDPACRSNIKSSFLKSGEIKEGIYISVGNGTYEDEAIIAVNESATNGFDILDAHKFISNQKSVPQVYTECEDKHKLVYNCLNDLNNEIPFTVTGKKNESYLLKIKININRRDNLKAELLNLQTNEVIDITDDIYTKITMPKDRGEAKFVISFYESTGKRKISQFKPEIIFDGDNLICKVNENFPGRIKIYNYSGVEVARFDVKQKTTSYPITGLTGIHIINYANEKINYSQKFNFK